MSTHAKATDEVNAVGPARLSAPFTLAGTRLDEALVAAEGPSSTGRDANPVLLQRAGLLLRTLVCHSRTSAVNGGEIFCTSASNVCLPGGAFQLFQPLGQSQQVGDTSMDTPAGVYTCLLNLWWFKDSDTHGVHGLTSVKNEAMGVFQGVLPLTFPRSAFLHNSATAPLRLVHLSQPDDIYQHSRGNIGPGEHRTLFRKNGPMFPGPYIMGEQRTRGTQQCVPAATLICKAVKKMKSNLNGEGNATSALHAELQGSVR
ncbi:hypothetical protein ABVT39_001398 [Epinephelus coioides]